jgi:hypothetical protein
MQGMLEDLVAVAKKLLAVRVFQVKGILEVMVQVQVAGVVLVLQAQMLVLAV